jgi:rSAM/selenodomain-associated transferase 2
VSEHINNMKIMTDTDDRQEAVVASGDAMSFCRGEGMKISIIIPVLHEEQTIAPTLETLSRLTPDEIIVVDGGSTDRTREIVQRTLAKCIVAPRGRARQMNAGAHAAMGDVLLFLHADTRLPPSALTDVRTALGDLRFVGGRFDVKLDREEWMFRLIGTLMNVRSRLTKIATGDQAIFVRRGVFDEIGGFPDLPLMEDVAFSRLLKKRGRIACLRRKVVTSARRWEKAGVWQTIFKMWTLRFLYFTGVSPLHFKRFYDDAR